MKNFAASFIMFTTVLTLCIAATLQKEPLPSQYKKWLDEEVTYIISQVEKDVFSKLQSDREREMFIEAFWKQRDPTPNSQENEFRTEHYRRISHANRYFGRETPRSGWRTDRGRIYIILGEPNDIQRFEGGGVYASEVWFYQGKDGIGLPAGFNIVFFKRGGQGEYRIYSPARDGPQALLAGYVGDQRNYEQAYEELREIEPSLASVSLSLIPGESSTTYGRPSLSSDILLQRVETTPQNQVRDKYARKFLEYKDIVEVEYSANFLDSDALIRVFRDPEEDMSFVHFNIEPQRLSVNQYENRFYTTLKLNGSLTTLDGKRVYQFDRTYNIDLTEEQVRAAGAQPFNLLDMFPVVPGDYRLSLLLKNEISKEFTSFEQTLSIPPGDSKVLLTPPVLAYRTVRAATSPGQTRAFQLGPTRLYAQPNRIFLPTEKLAVAFQVLGLRGTTEESAEIRITFIRDGQSFREERRKPSDLFGLPNVILEFDLADFPQAHYAVNVALLASGAEIAAATEEFDITYAAAIPRPWAFSRLSPQPGSAIHELALGTQLFSLGRLGEARRRLERAMAGMPDSHEAALALARLLMTEEEPGKAAEALAPFLAGSKAMDYDVYYVAGTALKASGNFAQALEVFEKAVGRFGVNTALLNVVGECHFAQGNVPEALAAWERSLKLSPGQAEIRAKVESLKKR